MANGHGGRRPGAGRKPKAISTIRKLAIKNAGPSAERMLAFILAIADDEAQSVRLRMAAAVEYLDRVWGKATQHTENKNSGDTTVRLKWEDD